MERNMVALLAVPLLALAIAVSAVATVPGILNAFSPAAPVTSIAAPAWKVGDRWTYNVSFAMADEAAFLPQEMVSPTSGTNASFVLGTVTATVSGSVSTAAGAAWNVTLDESFGHETPVVGTQPLMQPLALPSVAASGFAWVRQSDLALISTEKSVHLERSWNLTFGSFWDTAMLANGTYTLSYDAVTQVSYQPALTVWQFPMEQNSTWNVTSNATIHFASQFRIQGPNATFDSNHSATFTVPVQFAMRTGLFASVTTPAGTFNALPVWASHGEVAPEVPDRDASAMLNLTADMDPEVPHGFATAWFSSQVGNVVKADLGDGFAEGPRVELDLVSYTFS